MVIHELRDLVERWAARCGRIHLSPYGDGQNDAYRACANELSAVLDRLKQPPKPPQTDTRGERAPLPTGGVFHDRDSPLLRSQDDFGRRYASRTHMLDSGPVKPVDPTIAAEDPA